MKLRPEQLSGHANRQPAPLYLIHGDEPLLVLEAADTIRQAARKHGFGEREYGVVDSGFDWNGLLLLVNSGSLFASRRLIELRLGDAKPGESGAKALIRYAQRPNPDVVLAITAGKLDPAAQKSAWVNAIDAAGVVIQIWPIEARQLPSWISTRLHAKGMRASAEAILLLAARVEGNLLAAAQEIDKLYLLHGNTPIDADEIVAAVGESARFSIYDLADAALAGQAERVARIVAGLRGEGVEPILAAWALAKDIRLLALLRDDSRQGTPIDTALANQRVWEKRKPLLKNALQRLPMSACRQLVGYCAELDRVIKGAAPGNPWDLLLLLGLRLAGKAPLQPPAA